MYKKLYLEDSVNNEKPTAGHKLYFSFAMALSMKSRREKKKETSHGEKKPHTRSALTDYTRFFSLRRDNPGRDIPFLLTL